MAQDGAPKPGEKRGLDLGWLAGSAVQPAKRKEIEGISAMSIMDLQAQLFQAQESAKQRKDGVAPEPSERRRGALDSKYLMRGSNAGVQERNAADMQHVKSTSDRMSEAYAALERKAALYDKLAQGLVDDTDEKYEVDFLVKGAANTNTQNNTYNTNANNTQERLPGPPPLRDRDGGHTSSTAFGGDRYTRHDRQDNPWPVGDGRDRQDRDDERYRDRRERSESPGPSHRSHTGHTTTHTTAEEDAEAARRKQHKEVVMDIAQQTRQQRERAAETKRAKEEQAQARVDKLKEEFLKKQIAKLKQKPGAAAAPAASKPL